MEQLFGAIEAGGTKFNCLVATAAGEILAETRIPTTSPTETIGKRWNFFQPFAERGELAAIGIASFGPLDLNISSPTYGYITSTPKQGWEMTDMVGQFGGYSTFQWHSIQMSMRLLMVSIPGTRKTRGRIHSFTSLWEPG